MFARRWRRPAAALTALGALALGGPARRAQAQDRGPDPNAIEFRIAAFRFAMKAPKPEQRRLAMYQLATVSHPRAVEALAAYLTDDDDTLAYTAGHAIAIAAWALADEPRGKAVKTLVRAVRHHARTRELVAADLIGVLADLGDRRCVKDLVKWLRDRDDVVVLAAAAALGRLGDAAAVEPLLKTWVRQLRANATGHGTQVCEDALRRLTGRPLPPPDAWRAWWRDNEAAITEGLARRFGPPPGRAAVRPAAKSPAQGFNGFGGVETAVGRACDYLEQWLEDGARTGYGARARPLVLLALAHAGRGDRPVVAKAFDKLGVAPCPGDTYNTALEIMALEHHDPARWQQPIARRAYALVFAQGTDGVWCYRALANSAVPTRIHPSQTTRSRFPGVQLTGRSQHKQKSADPTLLIPEPALSRPNQNDLSNTQFAVLGLHAAERAHVRCPASTWKRIEKLYLGAPGPGWGYTAGASGGSISMTAGGISALACVREVFADRSAARQAAVDAAFDAPSMRTVYAVADQLTGQGAEQAVSRQGMWWYYQLYSIERACVLWDRPTLQGRDWYEVLSAALLRTQLKNGAWGNTNLVWPRRRGRKPQQQVVDSELNTAFAVLFLVKAAPEQRKPPVQITRSAFGHKKEAAPEEPAKPEPPATPEDPGAKPGD